MSITVQFEYLLGKSNTLQLNFEYKYVILIIVQLFTQDIQIHCQIYIVFEVSRFNQKRKWRQIDPAKRT